MAKFAEAYLMNDNQLSFTDSAENRRSAHTFFRQSFTEICAHKDHGFLAFFENSFRILRKDHKLSVMRSALRERILKNSLSLRKIKKLNHFFMVFPSPAGGRLNAFRFFAIINFASNLPVFPMLILLLVVPTCSSTLSLCRSVRSN
jgi:hypothetical protein